MNAQGKAWMVKPGQGQMRKTPQFRHHLRAIVNGNNDTDGRLVHFTGHPASSGMDSSVRHVSGSSKADFVVFAKQCGDGLDWNDEAQASLSSGQHGA